MSLETFGTIYTEELTKAVIQYPKEYTWPVANVPTVAKKMIESFKAGTYNKDGRAVKATCKRLNIKYTYKDINSYIKGA